MVEYDSTLIDKELISCIKPIIYNYIDDRFNINCISKLALVFNRLLFNRLY